MSLEAAVHYCAQAALTACRAHYATLPTMCLAMSCYFSGDAKGRRGRPPANLATTLIQDFAGCGIRLKGLADLRVARDAAADRST